MTNAQIEFNMQLEKLKMSRKERDMYPNIEAERVRNGLSREELARKIGISLSTYYNWLAGRTAIPSTSLKKMAQCFGVGIDYLLVEKEVV